MAPRSLRELIDLVDPEWSIIKSWLRSAQHPVDVLPVIPEVGRSTLLALQVTTRSPLGAMAYETGGMLVDSGWLRLLGSQSDAMQLGLLAWNGLAEVAIPRPPEGSLIVAHDALGGFFAVNLGAFGEGPRTIHYFAPGTLRWGDLGLTYADFLHWAITGDLATFYAQQRWEGWESETRALNGDQGFSFWPMLWSSQPPIAERSRRVVPQRELWALQLDLAGQLPDLPRGSHVVSKFPDDDRATEG